jgi:hypothetical protein
MHVLRRLSFYRYHKSVVSEASLAIHFAPVLPKHIARVARQITAKEHDFGNSSNSFCLRFVLQQDVFPATVCMQEGNMKQIIGGR